MKTFIKGVEVEGTPEEISKLLELSGEQSNQNKANTVNYSFTRTYIPNPCQCCSNFGKGPCHCVIPYMTSTGWQYRPDLYCSTTSSTSSVSGSVTSTGTQSIKMGASEK